MSVRNCPLTPNEPVVLKLKLCIILPPSLPTASRWAIQMSSSRAASANFKMSRPHAKRTECSAVGWKSKHKSLRALPASDALRTKRISFWWPCSNNNRKIFSVGALFGYVANVTVSFDCMPTDQSSVEMVSWRTFRDGGNIKTYLKPINKDCRLLCFHVACCASVQPKLGA